MGTELAQADMFFATARERYAIRLRRQAGRPSPWTEDLIFREWRFTNVHREDDRTTAWFREHVRNHLFGLAVAEATVIFRWFNRIETGERIKDLLLHGWDTNEARLRLTGVQPLISGAYKIGSAAGLNKLDGLLQAIDTARLLLPSKVKWWGRSLRVAWETLMEIRYLGPFLAYEIVSDVRHTPLLHQADDILIWANAGPGCTQGLGIVVADRQDRFKYHSKSDQATMRELMRQLLTMSRNPLYWPQEWTPWEMREVEHWCCEFAKYRRALHGQPLKRRFAAAA